MTDKFGTSLLIEIKLVVILKHSDVTKSYIRDNYIESEIEENII